MRRRAFLKTVAGASAAFVAGRPSLAHAQGAIALASTTGAVGLLTQVIKRAGLDKKFDLTLDVKVLNPAGAEKTVLLRQVDAGLFPVISAADVSSKGQDIVLFGPQLYMHSFLVVWQDAPYQKLEDLKGKKLALLDKVSGAYRGMQVVAAQAGMSFEQDFEQVTAPPPAVINFLQRRQVEAIVMHEPLTSKLLAEGKFRVIMGLNEEWKKHTRQDWLFLCLAAHREWLDKNRTVARRVNEAFMEAGRLVKKNPDLIEAEAPFLGLKTKTEIDLARQRLPQFLPTEWNETVAASVMETVREAVRLKQIPQLPSRDLVTVLPA